MHTTLLQYHPTVSVSSLHAANSQVLSIPSQKNAVYFDFCREAADDHSVEAKSAVVHHASLMRDRYSRHHIRNIAFGVVRSAAQPLS